jgi:hypothetical protein
MKHYHIRYPNQNLVIASITIRLNHIGLGINFGFDEYNWRYDAPNKVTVISVGISLIVLDIHLNIPCTFPPKEIS